MLDHRTRSALLFSVQIAEAKEKQCLDTTSHNYDSDFQMELHHVIMKTKFLSHLSQDKATKHIIESIPGNHMESSGNLLTKYRNHHVLVKKIVFQPWSKGAYDPEASTLGTCIPVTVENILKVHMDG